MSAEEALKVIKSNYPSSHYTMLREACDVAIKALHKEDMYKWHDLRKNPNDLPEEDLRVEIILYTHREFRNVFGILYKGEWIVNGFITYLDVVAWREIEPFKEGM